VIQEGAPGARNPLIHKAERQVVYRTRSQTAQAAVTCEAADELLQRTIDREHEALGASSNTTGNTYCG
jgi:hypothetical protein